MKRLLLILFLFSTPAFATTYYVDDTGTGTNCTQAQNPATRHNTIAEGIACLSGGDTLIIGNGTYDAQIIGTIPAGSMGAPTILIAENNRQAILFPQSPMGGFAVINIDEDYITIDGLVVDATNCLENGGYYLGATPDDVSNITIQNGIARNGTSLTGNPNALPTGILLGHGSNNIIRNMEITNFLGHGIYAPGIDTLVEDNYIHDWSPQGVITAYCMQAYPDPEGGIYRRNRCTNWQHGVVIAGSLSSFEIYNNLFYGSQASGLDLRYGATGDEVYFNVFYGNAAYGIELHAAQGSPDAFNEIITNNIFYMNGLGPISDQASNTTCTYNLGVSGGEGASDVCSTTASASNPLFVNGPAGDFNLDPTSPAIGAGVAIVSITVDIVGNTRPDPPSMGAYESPEGSEPGDDLLENFETYSTGVSIDGDNDGTGWTQPWVLDAGTATTETASCLTGTVLRITDTVFVQARRAFSGRSGEFTIQLKMCLSITNPDDFVGVSIIDTGGGYQVSVFFAATNIIYGTDVINETLQASYSANTPYSIRFNFDTVNQPNKTRVAVGAGAYTDWFSTVGSFTGIAGLYVNNYATNAHTFELDDISDDPGPPMLPPGATTPVGMRAKLRGRI